MLSNVFSLTTQLHFISVLCTLSISVQYSVIEAKNVRWASLYVFLVLSQRVANLLIANWRRFRSWGEIYVTWFSFIFRYIKLLCKMLKCYPACSSDRYLYKSVREDTILRSDFEHCWNKNIKCTANSILLSFVSYYDCLLIPAASMIYLYIMYFGCNIVDLSKSRLSNM